MARRSELGEFDDETTDPHRTLDPDERLALHGESTGDDLLAAVLADPANDGLRMVYGDYLIERGDPRGEFIQLQLETHRVGHYNDVSWHRMSELSVNRIPAWCAPLFPALQPGSLQFWRGFLWRCVTLDNTIALRDVIGHPMWCTVGDLETDETALIQHPCLRSLQTLRTSIQGWAALAAVDHESQVSRVVITSSGELGVLGYYADRELANWSTIETSLALRNLRALTTWGTIDPQNAQVSKFLVSPVGRQLVELEHYPNPPTLAHWVPILDEHPWLARLVAHPVHPYQHPRPDDRNAVVLQRDLHGLRLRVELVGNYRNLPAVELAASMASLFSTVELVPLDPELLDDTLAAIEHDLRRYFANVVVVR